MRHSEEAAINAENAYGEAAESYGVRQRRSGFRPALNVGYMDRNQYNEERAEEKRESSRGFGLRERFGHKYKYQGGKKNIDELADLLTNKK